MDNMGDLGRKSLINELIEGRELARQLQCHVNMQSLSPECRDLLMQKILASYEKILSMLNLSNSDNDQHQQLEHGGRMPESPPLSGSPREIDSEYGQEIKDASRKRKALLKWTQLVRITPGTVFEGPLDDGFSWRKYGKKDILGAKYPRGYYRCTHRNVQGCSATKQVQRSDLDQNIFEVTYRGHHTCSQATNNPPSSISPEIQEQQNIGIEPQQPQENQLQSSQDLLMNFQTGLTVMTEDSYNQEHAFPLYQFSSTSSYANNTENQMHVPSVMDPSVAVGSVSPAFLSPATSGTNYFSESARGPTGFVGTSPNFQTSELDEIISAATSASNSSTIGFDFPLGQAMYEPNFTFGNNGFFP